MPIAFSHRQMTLPAKIQLNLNDILLHLHLLLRRIILLLLLSSFLGQFCMSGR